MNQNQNQKITHNTPKKKRDLEKDGATSATTKKPKTFKNPESSNTSIIQTSGAPLSRNYKEGKAKCNGCERTIKFCATDKKTEADPGAYCSSLDYYWRGRFALIPFKEPTSQPILDGAPCGNFWCSDCLQSERCPLNCPSHDHGEDSDDSDAPSTFPMITGPDDDVLYEEENAHFLQARAAALELLNTGSIIASDPWGSCILDP